MNSIAVAILILIVVLILHLVEEVKTGFRQELPVGEMPLPVFVGLNAVIFVFCSATLALSLRNDKWATPLAWVFGAAMLINGLGHIGFMLIKREYFPGGLTAFLLILASGYLILQLGQ